MDSAVAVVAAVLLAYAAVERRLSQTPVSGAMVFTAVGLLASGQVTGLIVSSGQEHDATAFLELTLVIVLFTDAMAVNAAMPSYPGRRRLPPGQPGDTHPDGCPLRAPHCASSVVFPYPAGATTDTTGRIRIIGASHVKRML